VEIRTPIFHAFRSGGAGNQNLLNGCRKQNQNLLPAESGLMPRLRRGIPPSGSTPRNRQTRKNLLLKRKQILRAMIF